MIADPECIGHNGKCRGDGATGRKEARVHHVKVIQLVGLAINIERRTFRVGSEADGSVLVRHTGERDALAEEKVAGKQPHMTFMPMGRAFGLLFHEVLKFCNQSVVPFFVVGLISEHKVTLAVDRDEPGYSSIVPKVQAAAMKMPRPAASIKYSGQ